MLQRLLDAIASSTYVWYVEDKLFVIFVEMASIWEGGEGEVCEVGGDSAPVWDISGSVLGVRRWCCFFSAFFLFWVLLISNERMNKWTNDREHKNNASTLALHRHTSFHPPVRTYSETTACQYRRVRHRACAR